MVKRRLDTQLIHAGEPHPRIDGAVSMPIFQTSTFETGEAGSYHELRYLRLNNSPNHVALHAKLAAIEGAQAGLVTSSGMAAISTTLLALLRPGDHVAVQRGVYGGTFNLLVENLAALDISLTFFDGRDLATAEAAVGPKTKVLYCEAITNPLVEVAALPQLASLARERGIVSIVDSTFASPVNLNPVAVGFDLVLHSATKYLNGHSDLVAGAIVGRGELVERCLHTLNHLGGTLDPHACFLLHRGLKTLGVRVRQQNATALSLAQALDEHDAVTRVNYPGLPSHPDHVRAKELLRGFGGMLSFEVAAGADAAAKLLNAFELAVNAPSLGGPETLVTRPCDTSHKGMSPQQRKDVGVSDALVRVSVGLEDFEDLRADFDQALHAV